MTAEVEKDADDLIGPQLIAGPLGLKSDDTFTLEELKVKMFTTLKFMGILPLNVSSIEVNPIMVPDAYTRTMVGAV